MFEMIEKDADFPRLSRCNHHSTSAEHSVIW